ncbi:MAG: carboxypeptidase-like regulatory domain-containing protein [Planctomycetaceae bacterium]|nr:carboxypeptidase-like regulatory domain-containing protein [Planctomycetaceae bacterium]
MKNTLFYFVLILAAVSISGCGKPAGMPNLQSCTITVLDGGAPLADARVMMKDESNAMMLAINGITDSSGTAKMKTTYTDYVGNGVPAGKYKVIIDKEPANVPPLKVDDSMDTKQAEEAMKKWNEEYDKIRIVPIKLTSLTETPLTLEVNGAVEQKFDIAEYK